MGESVKTDSRHHAPATHSRARTVALGGLAIALLTVASVLAIPIGPVPITLQTAAVVLIALAFTPAQAAFAVGGYLLIGAAGLPVFAAGNSGLGVLVGPTGGFLIGFFVGATLGALVRRLLDSRGISRVVSDIVASAVVLICAYLLGWIQLAAVAGLSPWAAFLVGVAPFVIFDVAKAALAMAVVRPIRMAVLRS